MASDVLNLPRLSGSSLCEETIVGFANTTGYSLAACIQYNLKDPSADEMDWRYVSELEKLGWEFDGGAAIAYYFKKPADVDGCFYRLDFVSWVEGDENEIDKIGTRQEREVDWSKIPYGLILMYLSENPVCQGN